MRYSVTRLCGGKALMVTPCERISLDIVKISDALSKVGDIAKTDDMMLVMSWKGVEVTVYSQGKIMFYPVDDRDVAVSYANDILSMLIE